MGRFDVDYPHVRNNADIIAVLAGYGVEVVGEGTQRKGCCPLHEGENTALSANVERRVFKCHSCGSAGNVIKLVQLLDPSLENPRKAALKIAELSGISPKPSGITAPMKSPRAAKKAVEATSVPEEVGKAADGQSEATEDGTLSNRPLSFTLQLAPVEPDGDDPASVFVRERGLCCDRLRELGIGMGQRGSMKDRLAIPIYTRDEELVAYCGRDIGALDGADAPKYKFPDKFNRELELYGWELAIHFERVVVVESFLSVIKHGGVLGELGDNRLGIVALMNTTISDAQVSLLKDSGPEIIVCLDGDDAGLAATPQVAGKIASAGLWVIDRGAPDWKPHHDEPMQFYKRCCEV